MTPQTHTTITQWTNPTIIREYPSYPRYPWYEPYTIMCAGKTTDESLQASYKSSVKDTTCELKSGVYNVEI